MTKKQKNKLLISAALTTSAVAISLGTYGLINANNSNSQVNNRINSQFAVETISTNDAASASNSEIYFTIGEVLDFAVENGQYDNIYNNLQQYSTQNSPALVELIKISQNLRYYRLWKEIESTVSDQTLLNELKASKFPDINLDSLNDVITSQEHIQQLVANLNGYTESASVNITGIGNPVADEPIAGAALVDLSKSVDANNGVTLNLNSQYNTLVKVAEINSNAASDIVFSFTHSGPQITGNNSGRLVIKAANNALLDASTGTAAQFQNGLNVFGRWIGKSKEDLEKDPNLATINNFILTNTGSTWNLYVRTRNDEEISNLRIISGNDSTNIKAFGVLQSQLSPEAIAENNQISSISFFSTFVNSQQPSTTDTSLNELNIYIGDKSSFEHDYYTKTPNSAIVQNSYSIGTNAAGQATKFQLTYDSDLTTGNVGGGALNIQPDSINVIASGGNELSEGAIKVDSSLYNSYVGYKIEFSSDTFAFNPAKSNADGSYAFDPQITLSAEDYANKIFFEKPNTAVSTRTFSTKVINAIEQIDKNAEAISLLAQTYLNWANGRNASATTFTDNPLRLSTVSSTQVGSKYSNIELFGNQTIFSGIGPDLYSALISNNVMINNIVRQLTNENLQLDTVYTLDANQGQADALTIINDTILASLNTSQSQPLIQVLVDALSDESQNETTRNQVAELQLGKLIELVYSNLLNSARNKFNDLYTSALFNFLSTQALSTTQTFNTEYVNVENKQNVLANGFGSNNTNNRVDLTLFAKNSGNSLVTMETPSGRNLAKNYIDLIYKSEFGATLYASAQNGSATAFSEFASNSAILYDAEQLQNSTNSVKLKYLDIYSNLFRIINKDWNSVLDTYLASGDTINLVATGIGNDVVSFESWFNELNQRLDSNSNEENTKDTLNIYGSIIQTSILDNWITGANIYKSLQKRREVLVQAGTLTNSELTLLQTKTNEQLYTLQVIANYALATKNISPNSYVNEFSNTQNQVALAEEIINNLDLNTQITYSTSSLQSVVALTVQQANSAFVGTLYALGAITTIAAAAFLLARWKVLRAMATKSLSRALIGALVVGGLLLVAAVIATVVLL
ncbi:hypothetical protein EI74_0369 [Mycoplasma testudineum]|uniref:Lipoprotein-associated protein n=1 Tax=Mycoplasma testudineum TaxID=244584 RepID=A0A4R6IE38_9MOLU|nr:hypothetical protein [Mycoplasma testudineum]OYD26987.1 hypothetical protein CG473_01470 [Mycoplasma testudineum]TDO20533.1 hypothetical protein EI74_0369 [Mycoplasma testudineum]